MSLSLDYPEISPLSCDIESDGITIEVTIFRDDATQWTLETEDASGASTVWDETFATDQAALDFILKLIEINGIETLVRLPKRMLN